MSCKSALYCVNTSNPTLLQDASIPIGTIIRRFGRNINVNGSGILIQGPGYYDVNASFTVEPETVGTVTIQLYQNGVAIPGAFASATVAAIDTAVNLSFPAIIRLQGCNYCDQEAVTLEFRVAENSVVLNNAAVVVKRI